MYFDTIKHKLFKKVILTLEAVQLMPVVWHFHERVKQ